MSVLVHPHPSGVFTATQAEFDRALKRNMKGLDYVTTSGPTLGASPKDALVERGTLRL